MDNGQDTISLGTASDEALIELWREESDSEERRRLIGTLFERYQRKVALWCFRITGDREKATDLTQEVFMKLFENIQSFEANSRFSTWLYAITRNHCLNYVQKEGRRPGRTSPDLLVDINDPDSESFTKALEIEEEHEFLLELMEENLDEREKQVMILHYGHELTIAAVTRLLELDNPSGAKAYIVSAKRKLDRALQRHRARHQRKRAVRNFNR